MTQILRGQTSELTVEAYVDGDLIAQPTPTAQLVDLTGDIIATPSVSGTDDDGVYTIEVGPFDDVALYTVRLDFGSDYKIDVATIEVVGNFLFTEHQARNFQGGKLADETQFPDAVIAAERARIADWLEARTGTSWVPRYRRLTFQGTGTDCMSIWNRTGSEGPSGGEGVNQGAARILAATIDGQAIDTDLIVPEHGQLWLTSGTWPRSTGPANIILEVEYGHRHLMNGVDRIALLEAVDRLPTSRISRAATQATDDLGSYGWEPQNNGRPSRIPEVNEWCRTHDGRVPLA